MKTAAKCNLRRLKGLAPSFDRPFPSQSAANQFLKELELLVSEVRSLRRQAVSDRGVINCLKDQIFLMKYDAGVEPCETLNELSGKGGGPSRAGSQTHGAGQP